VCVVYSVCHNPLNWSTFEGQRPASHKKVFNHFGDFITAVSQQPVPTHADTKTSTYPIKDDRGNHRRPAPEKESCDGSKMRKNKKNAASPVNSRTFRQCGSNVVF